MTDTVLKPFNSARRRFAMGTPISDTDDVAPHAYGALKERGFVGTKCDLAAASAPSGAKPLTAPAPPPAAGE